MSKKNKSKKNNDVQMGQKPEAFADGAKIEMLKQALRGMGAVQINLSDVMKQKESGASVADAIRAAMNQALLNSDDPILKALAERVIGSQAPPVLTPDAIESPDAFARVMSNAGKSERTKTFEAEIIPVLKTLRDKLIELEFPFIAFVQTDDGMTSLGNSRPDSPLLSDAMRAIHGLHAAIVTVEADQCSCPNCTERREQEAQELAAAEARERAPDPKPESDGQ